MSSQVALHNTITSLIAGFIAVFTYEVVYFLTTNHQVRSGLNAAAVIGVITFAVAFVLGMVFRQIFAHRA